MADNMNQENAPKIYIMSRDNYDLVGTGEAPPSAPLEYGDNIFFVRENSSATADCLSLYVGQAKQCDVWDITDDPDVHYDSETQEVDIPDRYQIRGKIYIYENEISSTEKFIRLFIWDGVSYVSVGGSGGGTSVRVDHITINDIDRILTGAGADLTGKQYIVSGETVFAGNGAIALNNYPIDETLIAQGETQNPTASYPMGAGSVTSGTSNKVFGQDDLCFGSGNTMQEECNNNILDGSSNNINGAYYPATGTRTGVKSSFIQGTNNTLGTSGSNNIVSGNSNTLNNPSGVILFGNSHNLIPAYSIYSGNNNSNPSASSFCIVQGNSNVVEGSNFIAQGNSNTIQNYSNTYNPTTFSQSSDHCLVLGNLNTVSGKNVNVVGNSNLVSKKTNVSNALNNIYINGNSNNIQQKNSADTYGGATNFYIAGHNNNWNNAQACEDVYIVGKNIEYCGDSQIGGTTAYNIFCIGNDLDFYRSFGISTEVSNTPKYLIGCANASTTGMGITPFMIIARGDASSTAESAKLNLLVISQDGNIYLTPRQDNAALSNKTSTIISRTGVRIESRYIERGAHITNEYDDVTCTKLPENSCIVYFYGYNTSQSDDYGVGKITFTATSNSLWYPKTTNLESASSGTLTSAVDTNSDMPINHIMGKVDCDDYSSVLCLKRNPNITNAVDLVSNFSSESTEPRIYLLNPDVDISTYTKINILLFKDAWNLCAIVYGYEENNV